MTLLDHFQLFLIEAGLVRSPAVAGSLPTLWKQPSKGLPPPGQEYPGAGTSSAHPTIVAGLFTAPGIPTGRHDGGLRIPSVDARYRTKTVEDAVALDNAIRGLIHDERGYMLNGLRVQESLNSRDLQLLEIDDFGYQHVSGWTFWVHQADYAQV
jgi:hypothetical protein